MYFQKPGGNSESMEKISQKSVYCKINFNLLLKELRHAKVNIAETDVITVYIINQKNSFKKQLTKLHHNKTYFKI